MAKTWLSVRVELLSGRGEDLWPRPGRVFLVGPRHTFADFAAAIDGAFGRWDRSHLCSFTLETGEIFGWPDPDADPPVTDLSRALVAENIKPGTPFRYLFDYGDDWAHRCGGGAAQGRSAGNLRADAGGANGHLRLGRPAGPARPALG